MPNVARLRRRREGPEARLEDALVPRLQGLFDVDSTPIWIGGSIPVGAGQPDIVGASVRPELSEASALEAADAYLLGYLRGVRGARLETIVLRTHRPERSVRSRLSALATAGAITEDRGVYRLVSEWRDILPEIIAVEAKVTDWRRAVSQAARNRVFAHRVFVALPDGVARRVVDNAEVASRGIGVISVGCSGGCSVIRRARAGSPMVWAYYYGLAVLIGSRGEGPPR